jgi:hypothetical protein
MKRIRLTLSILVASVLGCVALNGTAAAAPQYLGVSSCTMNYDYCLGSTPIPRTLPSKLILSREECHGTTKKVQCGVQA